MKKGKLLGSLFLTFFKIGALTFGGGYAMIALIERACVDKKKWITAGELAETVVIAESTPGPIAVNCATYVGLRQAGIAGAVAATLGVVLPSFLVILATSFFLDRFLEVRLIAAAFRGVKIAVALLIVNVGVDLFRKLPKTALSRAVFACAALFVLAAEAAAWRFSVIPLLLVSAAVGIAVYAVSRRKKEGET